MSDNFDPTSTSTGTAIARIHDAVLKGEVLDDGSIRVREREDATARIATSVRKFEHRVFVVEDKQAESPNRTPMFGCGDLWVDDTLTSAKTVELCGRFKGSGVILCPGCRMYWLDDIPQGWVFVPGDVCEHGNYTTEDSYGQPCMSCEGESEEAEELSSID